MARKTLFDVFLFGRLIRYLESIPIDRDGLGISGIKETLRRLKRGEMVLIFPEGTRTLDGQVGSLKPGFSRRWRGAARYRFCRWASTVRTTPGRGRVVSRA